MATGGHAPHPRRVRGRGAVPVMREPWLDGLGGWPPLLEMTPEQRADHDREEARGGSDSSQPHSRGHDRALAADGLVLFQEAIGSIDQRSAIVLSSRCATPPLITADTSPGSPNR